MHNNAGYVDQWTTVRWKYAALRWITVLSEQYSAKSSRLTWTVCGRLASSCLLFQVGFSNAVWRMRWLVLGDYIKACSCVHACAVGLFWVHVQRLAYNWESANSGPYSCREPLLPGVRYELCRGYLSYSTHVHRFDYLGWTHSGEQYLDHLLTIC